MLKKYLHNLVNLRFTMLMFFFMKNLFVKYQRRKLIKRTIFLIGKFLRFTAQSHVEKKFQ